MPLIPQTSRPLPPDALVREKADGEVTIHSDLAGETRIAETGGSAVVPVLGVRGVALQPDAARRAEAASAAVHRLGQSNVGRQIVPKQQHPEIRSGATRENVPLGAVVNTNRMTGLARRLRVFVRCFVRIAVLPGHSDHSVTVTPLQNAT